MPETPPPDRRQPAWRIGTAAAVMVLLVVAGAWFLTWNGTSRAAGRQPAGTAPAAVTSLAEFFVAAHLSGTTPAADLATLAPRMRYTDDPTGYWVNRAAAVSAVPSADGVWVVTVAADVLELAGEAYKPAGIHYYQVTVDTSGPTPVVTTGPARIPRPQPSASTARSETTASADQQAAVSTFLDDYLTASGNADRPPPGMVPTAFGDPPYVSIETVEVFSDQTGRLRARVIATAASGAIAYLEYSLAATLEHGLWEINPIQTFGDTVE